MHLLKIELSRHFASFVNNMPSLEHRNTSTAAIDNNNNSTSTSHKPTCKADLKPPINMRDGVLAILLFALAFPIRMQNLDSPSQVV